MYDIYIKVMDFQSKTTRIIGLSHILQQHITEDIKAAVSLVHNYAKPQADKAESSKSDVLKDEIISQIKFHLSLT